MLLRNIAVHPGTLRKVAYIVGFPTLAFCLYMLWKHRDEDDDFIEEGVVTSRQTIINIEVPSKIIGSVIGRQGANLKEIQQLTGAKIDFENRHSAKGQNQEFRTATIRGTLESAQKAETLLRRVIAEQPDIIEDEIFVPQKSVGRIIGHSGETINSIRMLSKAKLTIEKSADRSNPDKPIKIQLTGARESIEIAKSLINEKLVEAEELHTQAIVSLAGRQRRGKVAPQPNPNKQSFKPVAKFLEMPTNKEFIEIVVSASYSPHLFWIQLVSPASMQLDLLIGNMTTYYSTAAASSQFEVLDSVQVGDIVAAPFLYDDSWYRAQVDKILGDGNLDLYYVDYGDTGIVAHDKVRSLRSDFFPLPFQAIECSMANIRPSGENWSEEACGAFEMLSHCAKWTRIMAKIVSYVETSKGSQPTLALMDTNGENDIDIASELVKQGFAEFIPSSPPSVTPSPQSMDHTDTQQPALKENDECIKSVNYYNRIAVHQILDLGKLGP